MIPASNTQFADALKGKLCEEHIVECSRTIPEQLEYLEFSSFLWSQPRGQEVNELSTEGYQAYVTYE